MMDNELVPRSELCAWSRKLHIYDGLWKHLLPTFHQSAIGRERRFPLDNFRYPVRWWSVQNTLPTGPHTLSCIFLSAAFILLVYSAHSFPRFFSLSLLPRWMLYVLVRLRALFLQVQTFVYGAERRERSGCLPTTGNDEEDQTECGCHPRAFRQLHILRLKWLRVAVLPRKSMCCFEEHPPTFPYIASVSKGVRGIILKNNACWHMWLCRSQRGWGGASCKRTHDIFLHFLGYRY